MDISIVILTRSQPQLLPRCVESCVREMRDAGLAGEIILVDNASVDGAPQRVAAEFPEVRLIRNHENRSFAAGNNQGIRASSGRLVLILNDDAILEKGSLRLMVGALDAEPAAGVLGPKLLNPDGSTQHNYTNCRFPRFHSVVLGWLELVPWLEKRARTRDLFTHYRDQEQGGETDWVGGCCLLARRKDLDAMGLLDEGYYFGMEDIDLCYRFRKRGQKVIYFTEARVTHYGSASLKKLQSIEWKMINIRALMRYQKKHSSLPEYLLFKVIIVAGLVAFHFPAAVVSDMRRRESQRRDWLFPVRAFLRYCGELRRV